MAKLEIPSIVVHNNGSGGGMERQRSLKSRLSKQNEFEEIEEDVVKSPELLAVVDSESGEAGVVPTDGGTVVTTTSSTTVNNNNKKSSRNNSKVELPVRSASMDDAKLGHREKVESNPPISRQRSHPKVKLLQRSHALRDDTSPPPELDCLSANTLSVTSLSAQSKSSSGKHHRLGKQGSSHSQGSMDGSSPALSRDSSIDLYTDSSGIDLQQFIVDTLHKNQKDRVMLFKIEQELTNLIKDNKKQHFKFPQMSAYQRMLVHRVAAFFGLDHNVDQAGTAVVVNKTKNTRIPDMRFREHIRDELMPDEPKKSILKRDSSSFEDGKDFKSPERQLSSESRRSKSFEEREEEYGKSSSSQEGAVDSPISRSHDSTHNSSRLSSQEDLGFNETSRPWSSTDSDSSNRANKLVITKTSASTESEPSSTADMPSRPMIVVPSDARLLLSQSGSLDTCASVASSGTDELRSRRPGIPKASSFGGISVLVRADSSSSSRSAGPRLSKAESFSCTAGVQPMACVPEDGKRPVSLGRPLNLHSQVPAVASTLNATMSSATGPISVATPMAGPLPLANPMCANYVQLPLRSPSQQGQPQSVMWAVSNMDTVPPGSYLINPQTGQAYLNNDGTYYRHNSTNVLQMQQPHLPPPPQSLPPYQQTQTLMQAPLAQQSPLIQQQQPPPQPLAAQPTYVVYSMQPSPYSILDQRQFVTDSSGGSGVIDLSAQLSNMSFATVPSSADRIASVDPSILHIGNPAGQILSQNFGAAPTARPPSVPLQQQQNSQQQQQLPNVAQAPYYFVPTSSSPSPCSNRPMRYMSQFSFSGNNQTLSQQPPPSSLMEAQQQHQQQILEQCQQQQHSILHGQMQGVNPQMPTQQTQPYQIPAGPCVYGYPVVGYSPVSGGDGSGLQSYYTVTPPSQVPISSACGGNNGGGYPGTYSYAVSPLLPQSGGGGGGNIAAARNGGAPSGQQPLLAHTSQPTSFVSGSIPMCSGRLSSSGGVALPPPAGHNKQLYQQHSQGGYRSQTPPCQQQQLPPTIASGGPGIQRTFSVGSPAPSCPSSTSAAAYGLYTHVLNPLPQQSHYQGVGPPPSHPPQHHLVQQQQQGVGPPLASQTPPLYSSYGSSAVVASLPLYRPNLQMMVKPNTPPPPPPAQHHQQQSFVTSTNGPYSTPPLMTKGFGIPMVDQRFVKSTDLYFIDAAGNVSDKVMPSPALHAIPNGSSGIGSPVTPLYNRGVPLVQGDLRLIGTPLQQQMQTPIRIPLMLPPQRPISRLHSPQHVSGALMASGAGGRSSKVRRQRSKGYYGAKVEGPTLTAPPVPERGGSGHHVLEVLGLPEGLSRTEIERYLEEIISQGAKLELANRNNRDKVTETKICGDFSDPALADGHSLTYLVFKSESAAQSAMHNFAKASAKFELRFLSSSHTPAGDATPRTTEPSTQQQQLSNLQGVS